MELLKYLLLFFQVLIYLNNTHPEKLSPKTSLTLLLSIMLGGFLGAVFVLTKNAIQKRKVALS